MCVSTLDITLSYTAQSQAQRRQYEGLLQHQIQSKMQASDYLTQAYLSVSKDFPWIVFCYLIAATGLLN